MRLPNDDVLKLSRRYLDLIGGRAMATDEKEAFIAETVDSYEKYVNRGFLTYRKSVTQAGQFAALEWSGQGSILTDLLGRQYIDCLGGYGIFSAGINHPKIVKAVQDQMGRMALNSQELLEPWRAGLARLLAAVTPGELGCCFFINNGTDAIEGAIKLARLYTRRKLPFTPLSLRQSIKGARAWVYTMTPGPALAPPVPYYLDTLVEGYRDCDLPGQQLATALALIPGPSSPDRGYVSRQWAL